MGAIICLRFYNLLFSFVRDYTHTHTQRERERQRQRQREREKHTVPPSCFVRNVHVCVALITRVCVFRVWHVRGSIWSKPAPGMETRWGEDLIMVSRQQLLLICLISVLFLNFPDGWSRLFFFQSYSYIVNTWTAPQCPNVDFWGTCLPFEIYMLVCLLSCFRLDI